MNTNSILISIKKLLGLSEEDKSFDPEIITHINSVLSILNQLGIGPDEGFAIEDEKDEWTDFIPDDPKLNLVKTYVHMKVRLMFDPPANSQHMDAIKSNISEIEWRITN